MPWPKGKPFSAETITKRNKTRANTLLMEAKRKYQGREQVGVNKDSYIDWDTLTLHLDSSGKRTRRFVSVICGICGKPRWGQFDNIIKQLRKPFFTGYDAKCVAHLGWIQKGRPRPERRKVTEAGYVKVFIGEGRPMADCRGETFEHRLVVSQKLGRPLTTFEHVHHLNGVKTDNRPENLEMMGADSHNLVTKMQSRIRELEKQIETLSR
jgi:hypothetical protein